MFFYQSEIKCESIISKTDFRTTEYNYLPFLPCLFLCLFKASLRSNFRSNVDRNYLVSVNLFTKTQIFVILDLIV